MSMKRFQGLALGSVVLSVTSIGLLTGFAPTSVQPTPQITTVVHSPAPTSFEVASTQELNRLFDSRGFDWPPSQKQVPPVVLRKLPADFAKLRNPELRKALFLRTMVPLVLMENREVEDLRQRLAQVFDLPATSWSDDQVSLVTSTAREYGVTGNFGEPRVQQALMARVDQVPVALVIGQAVLESGWGGASKMLQRNSLFGMINKRYGSLQESVRGYILNLNSNGAYAKFRQIRATMRSNGETLDAEKLAHGLSKYSTRGQRYVRDVLSTMRRHELSLLDDLDLSS